MAGNHDTAVTPQLSTEILVHSPDGDTGTHARVELPSLITEETPWDTNTHVLATSHFPGTSVLRNKVRKKHERNCSCKKGEVHRPLFHALRHVIRPSMKDGEDIPAVKVCWDAENLFESKLNRMYTGRKVDGKVNPSKQRFYFSDLKTVGDAEQVLYHGTYWFRRLKAPDKGQPGNSWGRNGRAMLRLLAGCSSFSGPESISQLSKMKLSKTSVNKLRNILAVVDGVLMSLILSFPDLREYNNWSRHDQIVNCLISLLLPDYFRNRDLDCSRLTTFEKVKQLRKAIKEQAFNPVGDLKAVEIPQEISFYERGLSWINRKKTPMDIYRAATLCQTRASGVPPKQVFFKTLKKIKAVLQETANPDVYRRIGPYIRPAVESIHGKILQATGGESKIEKFWSNCLEKAKISLSDSGEFFTNSEKGGKLEAARLVLQGNPVIPKIDLHTGRVIGELKPSEDPVGECLFHWACNEFRDRSSCYDRNIMSVRLSLVSELGKYRAITVSHLAHAMVLHVLSHVLLEYLKKVPSSVSGVGAANHAWNFFRRLSHKNPNANFIFGDKDVYLFSTDWEQATDYCDHLVSQGILNCLCSVLGVPNWYRQTVMFALCAPRQVEFIDSDTRVLECFHSSRGELMGDPVVKVILHYDHLVGRESALMLMEELRNKAHTGYKPPVSLA